MISLHKSWLTRNDSKFAYNATAKLDKWKHRRGVHNASDKLTWFLEAVKEQKRKDRGARESKIITVETYASVLTGPNADNGILPTSSRRSPPENSVSEDEGTISFFCGNPLVEVTKGVLHLYKEK